MSTKWCRFQAGQKASYGMIDGDSVTAAVACHDGPSYQAALKELKNTAERDFRIVEGVE